jgi:hypothetical protein
LLPGSKRSRLRLQQSDREGYSFAFRESASGRTATVNVEAPGGAVLSEDAAQLALWGYRKDTELPAQIVLGTDGGFRRS